MLFLAEKAADILERMHWQFLTSDNAELVTSDRPVCVLNPQSTTFFGQGLAAPEIEVTLPLSPSVCLLGTWKPGPLTRAIDERTAEEINRRTIGGAIEDVFASTERAAAAALEYYAARAASREHARRQERRES